MNRFSSFVTACAGSAALLPCAAAGSSGSFSLTPECNPRLFVANHSAGGAAGSLAAMCAAEPWTVTDDLAPLPATFGKAKTHTIRVFDGVVYVVTPDHDEIHRFDAETAEPLGSYRVGAGTKPHDIAVTGPGTAYVTRHHATHLLRVDLATGESQPVVDLSVFTPDLMPGMSMMAHDVATNRLFIQIQQDDSIAVFDVATESLIDAVPAKPDVQGIALQGALPQHKMQIDAAQRRLYVSAAGGSWGFTGGIEMIDLDALASIGFAFDAKDFGVPEVSAFIMVSATRGYVVFHTDITPSSHLAPFTIGQSTGISSVLDVLGWPMTHALEFDPRTGHVYMPHGGNMVSHPPTPGVYVLDAATDGVLTAQPIETGGWPGDFALWQRCAWDLDLDGAVDVFDLLALLAKWGPADSFEPADFDQNGAVDVFDLLALLAGWGPCR